MQRPNRTARLALVGLGALCGASPLLFASAPHAGRATLDSGPRSAPVAIDGWETLSAKWEPVLAEWTERYESAGSVAVRRELREQHPAIEYWSRFEALSREDGRAAIWLIEFAGRAGLRSSAAREAKADAYARALGLEGALEADWMGDLLRLLAMDRRAVGDEAFEGYFERVATRSKLANHRVLALFLHGDWLSRSSDEAARERGAELLRRAAEVEGAEESALVPVRDRLYELENLAVGALAPDFDAVTATGEPFRLSELRGKVVVLDFFGFW